eukprot:s78_g7.t3
MRVASGCGPHARWVHGQQEEWMHFLPTVQLCLLRRLVRELAEQLDKKWDSWQLPFFEAYMPPCSTPGPMRQESDLALELAASCEEGKTHGPRKKCTRRLHSDGESEEVEADDHSDRDGGIAEASTLQPVDTCQVKVYSMADPAPIPEAEATFELPMSECEGKTEGDAELLDLYDGSWICLEVKALETADGPPQASEASTVSPVAREVERMDQEKLVDDSQAEAMAMAEFGDALLKELLVAKEEIKRRQEVQVPEEPVATPRVISEQSSREVQLQQSQPIFQEREDLRQLQVRVSAWYIIFVRYEISNAKNEQRGKCFFANWQTSWRELYVQQCSEQILSTMQEAEGQGAQTQLTNFAARLGSFEQILSKMQEVRCRKNEL